MRTELRHEMVSRIVLVLIVFLLFIGQASADRIVNGTTYDTTWDGRVIPSSQIVYGSNDDTILVQELTPATSFTVGNDSIYINNNYTFFKREKFKISPVLTYSKSLLLSKMISVNASVGYLVFPYQLSRVKDFIDEHNIRLGKWNFHTDMIVYDNNDTLIPNGTRNYLPSSAYDYRIVGDEIRLYFLKSEANKLQGNISFEDPWTINGSTTPAWQNTSKDNTRVKQANDNVILEWTPSDASSHWTLDEGVGITANDENTTSNLDGTINGTWNTSGKFGTAIDFDGIDSNISVNYDYDFGTNSFTIMGYFRFISSSTNYMSLWGANSEVLVSMRNDRLRSSCRNGTSTYYATWLTTPSLNQYYHVAMTRNGTTGTVILYIDGVNRATVNCAGSVYDNDVNWKIGDTTLSDDILNGSADDVRVYDYDLTQTQINQTRDNTYQSMGNLTAWYDSGSGNEVYQIDVNATTSANTNYTFTVMNNDTDAVIQTWTAQTGNNSFTITGAVQDTKINVTLLGNQTTTPELMQVTFFDQAAGEEGDFMPPTPINCLSSNDTTWINLSCSSGIGNITNFMNFTNTNLSTWNNNSNFYWNNTGLSSGTLYDYRIYAYNSSGTGSLNLTYATISNTTLISEATEAQFTKVKLLWWD